MTVENSALPSSRLSGKREDSRFLQLVRTMTSLKILLPSVALVIFLVAWELFARSVNPILFPAPIKVIKSYGELYRSGELVPAFFTTMQTLTIGFLLSAVVGILGGVIIGRAPLIGSILDPYIEAIYATPRVVITPLVIIWFGVGDSGRLFIVFIGTFIPILMNTAIGVRNARPDLIEVGRSFGASEPELVRHVILPGAVPYLIAGLRIGVGRALIGVVIAEIFLDLTGLGGLVQINASYFRVDRMIAVVLILAAIGTLLMVSLGRLEARFSPWRAD